MHFMNKTPKEEAPDIAKIVERNVHAMVNRKKEDLEKRTITQKVVGSITEFAGSLLSVIIHTILFGGWVLWNSGWLGLKPFDPSFIIMATFAAVEAIFLTTFVLIGQKHSNAQADKWAELDLQVGFLTEHEVTRLLALVTAIAKKLDIEVAKDKELEELAKDMSPENVLDTMEKASELIQENEKNAQELTESHDK